MSDPLEQLCPDCGRSALVCEVLLARRAGLSGFDVHARAECSEATVERLRASLTAAEKRAAMAEKEERSARRMVALLVKQGGGTAFIPDELRLLLDDASQLVSWHDGIKRGLMLRFVEPQPK